MQINSRKNVKNAKVSKSTLVNESKSKSHSPAGREYFKFVKLSIRKTFHKENNKYFEKIV